MKCSIQVRELVHPLLFIWLSCSGFSLFGQAMVQKSEDAKKQTRRSQTIETSSQGAVFQIEIPGDAYEHAYYDNLRDLRVVNANQEVVPHSFYWKQAEVSSTVTSKSLVFFPIEGKSIKQSDSQEVVFSEGPEGTSVKVLTKSSSPQKALKGLIQGYLVDLRSESQPLSQISLDWKTDRTNATVSVTVSTSSDLKSWTTIASSVSLAKFDFDGESLAKNSIELEGPTNKFLRISALDDPSFRISKVEGFFLNQGTKAEARQVVISDAKEFKDGQIYFEKSAFAVDRLKLELGDVNSLHRVDVYSRSSITQPAWTKRFSTTAYRMAQSGREIASGFERLSLTSDRFWKVVSQSNVPLTSSLKLTLKFEGPTKYLYFLANGLAPFKLVYGESNVGISDSNLSTISDFLSKPENAYFQPVKAVVSNQSTIENIIQPKVENTKDWRKYILWSFLFVAVGMTSLMAWKLYSEMNQPKV